MDPVSVLAERHRFRNQVREASLLVAWRDERSKWGADSGGVDEEVTEL